MEKRSVPALRAETEILCNRIAKLEPGELLTYAEMSKLIAQDVQGVARGVLTSARNKAANDFDVVTVTVIKEGIRRAMGADYGSIVSSALEHTRRKTRRALKHSLKMPQEEYDGMPHEKQVDLNLKRTTASTLLHFSSPKVEKQLGAAVSVKNSRLAIGDVLKIATGE